MAEPDGDTQEVRIAAVGDLHFGDDHAGTTRRQFAGVSDEADILLLCGDLTTHGRENQIRALIEELADVDIPIVAVLGNHDYESGNADLMQKLLQDSGVHVLDGDHVVIRGIGFAGTKGFAGGFGRGSLAPFGEQLVKDFVQGGIDEAIKLENALRNLKTETKVAVLHFAPIVGTVLGEPEVIYPFLGSSRLEQPLDMIGATVVFHGHAHHGTPSGRTSAGIPVFNVSLPLLVEEGRCYRIWRTSADAAAASDQKATGPASAVR